MPLNRARKRRENPPRLFVHLPPTELERLHSEAARLSQRIRMMMEGRKFIMKRNPPESATAESRQILFDDMNQAVKEEKMELDKIRKRINELARPKKG